MEKKRIRPVHGAFPAMEAGLFRQIALRDVAGRVKENAADPEQVGLLRSGSGSWNQWRETHRGVPVQLAGVDLSGFNLEGVQLSGASLLGANLEGANLSHANLSGANLSGARMNDAVLHRVNGTGAILIAAESRRAYWGQSSLGGSKWTGADVTGAKFYSAKLVEADFHLAQLASAECGDANLIRANFTDGDLRGMEGEGATFESADFTGADCSGGQFARADFRGAKLLGTNFDGATLTGSRVHGCSVWRVSLEGAKQDSLILTDDDEPRVTVDDLEVAQFLYLLLNNQKLRGVLDTITSKVVLILGRFTPARKAVLDALREELRRRNYMPVLFDFEKQGTRSRLETISTLAHLARFVIADLTDAKSVLQELQAIVPLNPSVPVQPLIQSSQSEPGMFDFFRLYPWVLETVRYQELDSLLEDLAEKVIGPAERARRATAQ